MNLTQLMTICEQQAKLQSPYIGYLASPYSNFPGGYDTAHNEVSYITALLMERGLHIFCPIAHNHYMANKFDLPRGFDYWKAWNSSFIRITQYLIVAATMLGWENSAGVLGEKELAEELSHPINILDSID